MWHTDCFGLFFGYSLSVAYLRTSLAKEVLFAFGAL